MDLCNIDNIKYLLAQSGFRFSKSMGQNFLIERWVPEKIAAVSEISGNSGVLEIGPGIGALTVELSKKAGRVLSVELDKDLIPLLRISLSDCGNTEVISGDILKLDIPELVKSRFSGLRPVVCSNLPYNITTPVLTALINSKCFESITVMIQREVAGRICAAAGTRDYGSFSVFVQYYTEPQILFDVPPECFIPRPKVYSSVLKLIPRENPPVMVADESLFFRTVRASFEQRRKTLANSLRSGFPELDKPAIDRVVASCGLDPMIRGEALDMENFASVSGALGELL